MEKATQTFSSIKSKISRTLSFFIIKSNKYFLEFVEKYNLSDESNQMKLAFAVLTGITAVVLLKKAISKSGDPKSGKSSSKKSGIKNKKKSWSKTKGNEIERGLSYLESEFRKSVIKQMEYGLVFFLDPSSKTSYKGMASLRFQLDKAKLEKEGPLFLDFQGKELSSMRINGHEIKDAEKLWKRSKIELPTELLVSGSNIVEIYFKNKFAINALEGGLFLFKDNNDHYVYTVTEPFSSHKIYPCFDQPSIKASIKLLLVTPDEWKVASNDTQVNVDDISSGFSSDMSQNLKQALELNESNWKLSAFNINQKISTSSFGFVAGPFETLSLEDRSYNSPNLSLNVKRSLIRELKIESEDLFLVIANAIEYLEGLFGRGYSLEKNDIFFLPHVPEQGLHLSGCCLVNENLLTSFEVDLMARITRSVNIIHQLAFSWFGHSVGTEWLKDNWLDQGLSHFIAHLALTKVCRSLEGKHKKSHDFTEKDVWNHFAYKKAYSLLHGNLQVYYPISLNLDNIKEYEAIDSASHQLRAAAVWKQFFTLVGEENFKRGIKKCYSECEGGFINTEKFIKVFEQILKGKKETPMGESTDHFVSVNTFDIDAFDLKEWVQDWINTEGLNNFEIIWERNNAMFNNMIRIKQTVESDGQEILRNHRCKIAFLDSEAQVFKLKDFLISAQEFNNLMLEDPDRMPQAFLIDSEGNSLFSSKIEADSLNFFIKNIHIITDEFLLSAILGRCAYMVTTGTLSPVKYIRMIVQLLDKAYAPVSVLILQQSILLAHYILEHFSPSDYQTELKTSMFEVLSIIYSRHDTSDSISQVILNELWRFIARKDHVKNIITIFNRHLINSELHKNSLSLISIFNTFRACYLIDKDSGHYNEFLLYAHSSGFKTDSTEELRLCFEECVRPEVEKELNLIKDLKSSSHSIYPLEGLKKVLASQTGSVTKKKLFEIIENKAEDWSTQLYLEVLGLVRDLFDDIKLQEELINEISRLKIKGKDEITQNWVKMKLAELNRKKIAYQLL